MPPLQPTALVTVVRTVIVEEIYSEEEEEDFYREGRTHCDDLMRGLTA